VPTSTSEAEEVVLPKRRIERSVSMALRRWTVSIVGISVDEPLKVELLEDRRQPPADCARRRADPEAA